LVIGNDYFTPSFAVDQLGYGHVACHTGGNTSIFDIYHVKSSEVLTYLEESKDTRVGAGPGVTLGLSPNPVQDYTYISYNTTVPDNVVLTAYNSLGAEVARLVDEHRTPGINRIVWYPYGLSAGVYFLRLRSGGSEQAVKCVLLPR